MIRKEQIHELEKGDILGQVKFIAQIFGVAATEPTQQYLLFPNSFRNITLLSPDSSRFKYNLDAIVFLVLKNLVSVWGLL